MTWLLFKKEMKENFYAVNGMVWFFCIAVLFSLMAYSFTIETEWSFMTQTDILVAMTMMVFGIGILMTILVASVSISSEKENGTLESLLLTPTTTHQIAHSKILSSMTKWLIVYAISTPYIYALGNGTGEIYMVLLFILIAGSVLMFSYAALSVGISFLTNSSKNALVLSVGVFIATLMPLFLPDAFKATGVGQMLENISPLANMTNLMANVVFMQLDVTTQLGHIVSMLVYTLMTYGFLKLILKRYCFEGGN